MTSSTVLTSKSFSVMFDSTIIVVTCTASPDIVTAWISDIRRVNRPKCNNLLIAIDCVVSSSREGILLLNLCVRNRCLIFQILHANSIPLPLRDFLNDERYTFTGVAVGYCFRMLQRHCADSVIWPQRAIELQRLGEDMNTERRDLKRHVLSRLAMQEMGWNIDSMRGRDDGKWDVFQLKYDLVKSAALDCFICFKAGKALSDALLEAPALFDDEEDNDNSSTDDGEVRREKKKLKKAS